MLGCAGCFQLLMHRFTQNATEELARMEAAFDMVKRQLFDQLHDVVRQRIFYVRRRACLSVAQRLTYRGPNRRRRRVRWARLPTETGTEEGRRRLRPKPPTQRVGGEPRLPGAVTHALRWTLPSSAPTLRIPLRISVSASAATSAA